MRRFAHRTAIWCSLALVVLSGCGSRREFPAYPITLVCPWAAGGGTDRVSRQLAAFLEKDLGVPVNVINATGGAGVTGHLRGLKARPDGYTIGMITVELNILHWRGLTNLTWLDSEPLMAVNRDAAALFVQSKARWNDLSELLNEAQNNSRTLTASGTASGGIWHLALAGWLQSEGISPKAIRWVPMAGAGPSLQELVSGGLDMVVCSLPEAKALYQSGELRCLGVMGDRRVPGYEEVPTFRELGSDWTMVGWRGLAVPKGTPQKIQDRLVESISRVTGGQVTLGDKTFPDFMRQEGFDYIPLPPLEFRAMLETMDRQFGDLLSDGELLGAARAGVSAYTYPLVLVVIFTGLLIALVVRSFRGNTADSIMEVRAPPSRNWPNFIVVAASVVFFAVTAESLGFILASAITFLVTAWCFRAKPVPALLTAVLLVPLVYHFFGHVLRVPLPRGMLGW